MSSDIHDETAARLLPCEHGYSQRGTAFCDDLKGTPHKACVLCQRRPTVATALRDAYNAGYMQAIKNQALIDTKEKKANG